MFFRFLAVALKTPTWSACSGDFTQLRARWQLRAAPRSFQAAPGKCIFPAPFRVGAHSFARSFAFLEPSPSNPFSHAHPAPARKVLAVLKATEKEQRGKTNPPPQGGWKEMHGKSLTINKTVAQAVAKLFASPNPCAIHGPTFRSKMAEVGGLRIPQRTNHCRVEQKMERVGRGQKHERGEGRLKKLPKKTERKLRSSGTSVSRPWSLEMEMCFCAVAISRYEREKLAEHPNRTSGSGRGREDGWSGSSV